MKDYFSGNKIYGDDFYEKCISQWLGIEIDGHYNLDQDSNNPNNDGYHTLNDHHFYRHLEGYFETCVALDCTRGDDISPISNIFKKFLAIEPAKEWWSSSISGTPTEYPSDGLNSEAYELPTSQQIFLIKIDSLIIKTT